MKKPTTRILRVAFLVTLPALLLLHTASSGAQPVIRIAAGVNHSLFLKSDGSLWAMGDNRFGELGDGTTNGNNLPKEIIASNVVAIAGGFGYSLFVKTDGSLWAMGYNGYGQLGDGTTNNSLLPEKIVASNVAAIAAGLGHSLFVKTDGSLWAMGQNQDGQLGDGAVYTTNSATTIVTHPEMIAASSVNAVAAGWFHSLFLKNDGSLWAMGANGVGQFGNGTYQGTNRPTQVFSGGVTAVAAGITHSLFVTNGCLMGMGDNTLGQLGAGAVTYPDYPVDTIGVIGEGTNITEIEFASNVVAIAAAGANHSLYLESDGSLWAMGENISGDLGDGTYQRPYLNFSEEILTSGVTAIATGRLHSLFLKNDGSLWAMGANGNGQLGDGTYNQTNRPEEIVAGPPGYNQISVQLLSGGKVELSYVGMTGTNYELDRSFSLAAANWLPQATNPAGVGGALLFTNSLNPVSNNFWRIRTAP